jgi:hypothetical protein
VPQVGDDTVETGTNCGVAHPVQLRHFLHRSRRQYELHDEIQIVFWQQQERVFAVDKRSLSRSSRAASRRTIACEMNKIQVEFNFIQILMRMPSQIVVSHAEAQASEPHIFASYTERTSSL